jgi:hypothetical protein
MEDFNTKIAVLFGGGGGVWGRKPGATSEVSFFPVYEACLGVL